MSFSNDVSKIKVEAASAFTAVCAYHPIRTLATRAMTGKSFTVNPLSLYAGFSSAVMGAHQLFAMSAVYHVIGAKNGDIFSSCMAGVVTAPTVTLCDAWCERKQEKQKVTANTMGVVFRGFTPTVFRQMGLAMGMFVFPSWIEREFSHNAPDLHKRNTGKMPYAVAGGIVATMLTHYPATVAVIMQKNPQMTLREACRVSLSVVASGKGVNSCALRMAVVGVAFTIMQEGREYYSKIFNREEIQS